MTASAALAAARIHPTAIVEAGAVIGAGSVIGPWCQVGAGVRLGADNHLQSHVVVCGNTTTGPGNEFFPFSCIGSRTEDKKYAGSPATYVDIGERNVFREHVTVNAATGDGGRTVIGSDNVFLSDSHVGHECIVGNDVVIGCGVKLAGHVEVEDFAIVNGMTGVIQFVRIGRHAFIGATNKVTKDILPFAIAEGNPSTIRGVNVVGLGRRGFTESRVREIRRILRALSRSSAPLAATLASLQAEFADSEDLARLAFFVADSKAGVAQISRGRGQPSAASTSGTSDSGTTLGS